MASEIRVNQIQNRSGLSTVTFSDTGVVISGITTISDLRTSGTTVVAAGTTNAPSISPTGDSNTGIFFPSPDTVAIAEGGVEVLRVDSSSNVGINTANPTDKLTIFGKIQVQQDSGSNNRIIFRGQPSSSYRWNIDNHSSSNTFRIYREDDATSASGATAIQIDPVTRNVSINGGNLVFDSGKGIDFSANSNAAGMTSELLDDYEEGTWTPVLVSRSSPSGSLSYTQNTGKYVKVGDLVYISAFVTWNSGSIGGSTVQLSGLPFIAGANRERGGLQITYSASGWVSGATIYQQCFRSETNETNAIYNFSDATDGKIDSTIAGSQIASTGEFMVTGTYCI